MLEKLNPPPAPPSPARQLCLFPCASAQLITPVPAAGSDRSPAAGAYLGVILIVGLLRPNPSADEVVSHGVGDGEVEVERGRGMSVLHLGVMEVTIELLFHCRHIFQLGDPTDGYLLPSVGGGPRTCWVAKLGHGRQLRSLRCQFRTTAFVQSGTQRECERKMASPGCGSPK